MNKQNKIFLRFVNRLKDRGRFPRSLWWPLNNMLVGESDRARVHDECSAAINRVFLSLVVHSLFCLITLGGSDLDLLGGVGGEIKVPFASVQMAVKSFLIVGPLVLIALTLYMHLFVEEWSKLHTPVPRDKRTAKFFNFDGKVAKVLTGVAFYWLTPAMLYFFYWKSLPLPFAALLFIIFVSSSLAVILASIRRCPENIRLYWNAPKWIIALALVSWSVSIAFNQELPSRPLLLSDVQLEGKNLIGLKLQDADMSGSNLKKASLSRANLTRADLTRSQLAGADFSSAILIEATLNAVSAPGTNFDGAVMNQVQLREADLAKSTFSEADLSGADMRSANLAEAKLKRVKLNQADLTGAVLTGADLTNAWLKGTHLSWATITGAKLESTTLENVDLTLTAGVTKDQLRHACLVGQIKLPKGLTLAPEDGKDCPPSEPTNLRMQ